MSKLFLAAVASFIGGLLVYLFQVFDPLELNRPSISQISLAASGELVDISSADLDKIERWRAKQSEYLPAEADVSFRSYVIQNNGNQDIKDSVFQIKNGISGEIPIFIAKYSDPVEIPEYDFQQDEEFDWNEIQIQNNARDISFPVPLIKSKEEIYFFTVSGGIYIPKVLFRKENTTVSLDNSILDGSDGVEVSSALDWFMWIFVGLGILLVGIGISEALNNEMLKKIGFDPKNIAKLYKEELEKNGK